MDDSMMRQLLSLMDEDPEDLGDTELTDYIWLVEQLLLELRQAIVIRRNTPINTPAGSSE